MNITQFRRTTDLLFRAWVIASRGNVVMWPRLAGKATIIKRCPRD